ncbi:hypothetical protein LXL04_036916 [Taraxacum kok-saghyz]
MEKERRLADVEPSRVCSAPERNAIDFFYVPDTIFDFEGANEDVKTRISRGYFYTMNMAFTPPPPSSPRPL